MVTEFTRNGITIYAHTAWADDEGGTNFSLEEYEDAIYAGSYVSNDQTSSEDPETYAWARIDNEMVVQTEQEDDELETDEESEDVEIEIGDEGAGLESDNGDLLDELMEDLEDSQEEQQAAIEEVSNAQQETQNTSDVGIGNPNELAGTNQGTSGWTASAGLTMAKQSGIIYSGNDKPVDYIQVTCNTAGNNYIKYNADALRAKLAEDTSDNSYTFSCDVKMSELFIIPSVDVKDLNGGNKQIGFDQIDNEPRDDEDIDNTNTWLHHCSTGSPVNVVISEETVPVDVSDQALIFDLSEMTAGTILCIANLKIEEGALETPWRRGTEEVEKTAQQALTEAMQAHIIAQKAILDTAYIRKAVIGSAELTSMTAVNAEISQLLADQFTAQQISIIVADINTVAAGSITADNLDVKRGALETLLAGDFTAAEITAIGAAFTTATMSSLVTESLTAQYATISFANIGTETVKELFCNVGLIENAVIQDGKITGTLAGVTVVADLIQANTIVAGDLLVQDPADTDTYYRINLSESHITADEVPASAMAQYLNGNDIVAHSITTRHITAEDLMGTSGWINLAKGTFEYLNAEQGTGVSWDGSEFKILSGAGSGTLPIVAAWIDSTATEYGASWLTDEDGQTITPATDTIYLIQNDPHKHQYYLWNGTAYADADLFANSMIGNNIIAAADTANATAAKTSSIRYENGELILADSTSAFAVKITNTKLAFVQGEQEVAYITGNQLYIPYTVVLNAMDIGPWRWRKQDNGNLTLQYIG